MARSRAAPRPRPAPAARPAAQPAASHSSSRSAPHPPPPAQHHAPPPPAMPQSSGGGMLSGMMGAVAQGMAMGTGSAIAHRAVDSVMGPRTVEHVHTGAAAAAPMEAGAPSAAAPEGPCATQAKAFADCISRSGGDMNACQAYFESMQQCKLAYPSFA